MSALDQGAAQRPQRGIGREHIHGRPGRRLIDRGEQAPCYVLIGHQPHLRLGSWLVVVALDQVAVRSDESCVLQPKGQVTRPRPGDGKVADPLPALLEVDIPDPRNVTPVGLVVVQAEDQARPRVDGHHQPERLIEAAGVLHQQQDGLLSTDSHCLQPAEGAGRLERSRLELVGGNAKAGGSGSRRERVVRVVQAS